MHAWCWEEYYFGWRVKITVFEAGGVGSLLRRFSAFVVVFGCLLPALVEGHGSTGQGVGGRSSQPNILFILTDDQRFDATGYAGHPIVKTPNIDAIAHDGVRFSEAFVTTPICAASRASILTGSYERRHKFTFGTPPISAELCGESYPALLKAAGYKTGLVGKFGVSVAEGQAKNMFDLLSPIGYPFLKKMPNGDLRHIDQIATDRALQFIEQCPQNQPFCLSVWFNSPHAEDGEFDRLYPWPKTVDGWYEDASIPVPSLEQEKIFQNEPPFLQRAMNRIRWFWQFDTQEKYVRNVRSYYRMISGIDFEIGRLRAELKARHLDENTVIVFMSDNGYFLGERGFSGKWVHYEQSLRVPMVIMDPRLPEDRRGKTISNMALNIDIAPTVLELAGIKTPTGMQGKSLMPLITARKPSGANPAGTNLSWRKEFFCEHLLVDKDIPQWEGVRGERYVYARYFGQAPAYEFLHDLKSDPLELKNLASNHSYKKVLDQMRQRNIQLKRENDGEYSIEKFPLLPKKNGQQ